MTGIAALGGLGPVRRLALIGPSLVPYDPIASDVATHCSRRAPRIGPAPTSSAATSSARIIVAARLDLAIAASAVTLSFALGAVIGGAVRLYRRTARPLWSAASSTC